MNKIKDKIIHDRNYGTSWKKDWPDSQFVGFTYHAGNIPTLDYLNGIFNEVQKIDFTIDETNMIKVSYESKALKAEGKHEFKILESRKEELLERLADIVTSETSYSTSFYDDTLRHYEFIFENGERVSYGCPIGNGKEYITQPMREYLNVHGLVDVGWMF